MTPEQPPLPEQQETMRHPLSAQLESERWPGGEVGTLEEELQLGGEADQLPPRPRRRLLTPLPLALLGALLVALGFIGGVLVEKGQGSSSPTGVAGGAFASRLRALGGRSAFGSGAGASVGAFARPTAGTVSYLAGSTLYVTDGEGNTIKVTTSEATSVTKNVTSSVGAIHPGETVTITGATGTGGALSAEAITVGSSGGFAGLFGLGASGSDASGSGGSGSSGSTSSSSGEVPLFGNG